MTSRKDQRALQHWVTNPMFPLTRFVCLKVSSRAAKDSLPRSESRSRPEAKRAWATEGAEAGAADTEETEGMDNEDDEEEGKESCCVEPREPARKETVRGSVRNEKNERIYNEGRPWPFSAQESLLGHGLRARLASACAVGNQAQSSALHPSHRCQNEKLQHWWRQQTQEKQQQVVVVVEEEVEGEGQKQKQKQEPEQKLTARDHQQRMKMVGEGGGVRSSKPSCLR